MTLQSHMVGHCICCILPRVWAWGRWLVRCMRSGLQATRIICEAGMNMSVLSSLDYPSLDVDTMRYLGRRLRGRTVSHSQSAPLHWKLESMLFACDNIKCSALQKCVNMLREDTRSVMGTKRDLASMVHCHTLHKAAVVHKRNRAVGSCIDHATHTSSRGTF